MGKIRFTNREEIEEVIHLYNEGMGSHSIALRFNTTHHTVTGLLRREGVSIRMRDDKAYKRYSINDGVFAIDSRERDYWTGFLSADGNIYNGAIRIELKKSDKKHIEKFRNFLESDHPIVYHKPRNRPNAGEGTYYYGVKNKKIISDLNELGIYPNKTFTFIPHPLQIKSADFWRGVIDGDGHLFFGKGRTQRGNPHFHLQALGTEKCMSYFLDWTRLVSSHNVNVRPKDSIFRVSFVGAAAKDILSALYDDAPVYLDRKYQTYLRHRS
jgi:hypothetical protein